MTVLHSTLTANHIPHAFTYANAAARVAASGFTSGDIGKLAKETDSGGLWMLTATTPVWTLVSPGFTPPALSQFTIINTPAGSTSSDTSTGLTMICPTAGLTLYAFQDAVAAGGTFTLTAGFYTSMPGGNAGAGVYVADGSGKIVTHGIDCINGNFSNVDYWTNSTSFSSNPLNVDTNTRATFAQLVYDGTNFLFYNGNDLNALLLNATVSATAFLGTPTHVGIFVFANSSPAAVTFFHYKHV